MTKTIENVLNRVEGYKLHGDKLALIKGITSDSRKVKSGFAFIAVKGSNYDGHKFINEAVKNGATVIVCEGIPSDTKNDITFVEVQDSRLALGMIASAWFNHPSEKLKVIGVTGTDGKTTTCHLIYQILKIAGKKVGLVSTIFAKIGDEEFDTGFHVTNPDPISLQEFLAKMVKSGCEYAVIEVTSHGIDQKRIAGVKFDTTVLTNITPEHLDYHKTFDAYRRTKISFLKSAESMVVINHDDRSYSVVERSLPKNLTHIFYSIKNRADVRATEIEDTQKGLEFNMYYQNRSVKIISGLHGLYNVSNMLAAVCVSEKYKISPQKIAKAISIFKTPAGRFQEINTGQDYRIIIDFAHTPNALSSVLGYLKSISPNRLITVFGCAGERDKSKRREMGKISGRISDISIFTAEDPRSEKVEEIIDKISSGARSVGSIEIPKNKNVISKNSRYFIKIPERGEAIYYAINKLAKRKDIVVICGKGHERSMSYNGKEYPWSDELAVRYAVKGKILSINRD